MQVKYANCKMSYVSYTYITSYKKLKIDITKRFRHINIQLKYLI